MKFSVTVPVYNVEKYLAKCLDSILNQTYSDFEIIIVNDGSPDNSQKIIDTYAEKYPDKIKAYVKENGGLSDARNFGVRYAEGDYLLFVDSDDCIDVGLLAAINGSLEKNAVDVLRFSAVTVTPDGKETERITAPELYGVSGEYALNALIDNGIYFEPAPFYAYKSEFWKKHGFSYAVGRYHEDFGLTPEIIFKAESFTSIAYVGYYYLQNPDGIMRGGDYARTVKKSEDTLSHILRLKNIADTYITDSKIRDKFLSYLANAGIAQLGGLVNPEKNDYKNRLKEEGIFGMLLSDTLKRKAKKLFIKLKYGAF